MSLRRWLVTPALAAAILAGVAAARPGLAPAASGARLGPAQSASSPPPSIPAPSRQDGADTALMVAPGFARAHPGYGHRVAWVPVATDWSAEPLTLLVLGSADRRGQQWLEVRLPERPNRSTGWISRNLVRVSHTPYWIVIRTRARAVVVYRSGRLLARYRAVVGQAATPTPYGLFSVYEANAQPSPDDFLGPWALPLTAFSPTLQSFGGGPGRVAIHGRGGSSLLDPLGSARSHGCIRIDNGPITWIAEHVPLGAPVNITS